MSGIEPRLRGRWRIIEARAWDTDYLDLVDPAFISFGEPGTDDAFAFGGVTASLDYAYSPPTAHLNWLFYLWGNVQALYASYTGSKPAPHNARASNRRYPRETLGRA